jgi:chemotaxis protein MotB
MGGAWKVAYADLVTGLFALFMCLWLTSVDEDVMQEIAEHFKNPNTRTTQASPGTIDIKNANVATSRRASFSKPAIVPKRLVRKTTEDIEKSFVQSPEFQENENMHVEVIDEGIKLSLFNSPKRSIFDNENGQDGLSEYGNVLIDSLGVWLSRKYDVQGEKIGEMDIEIEGHSKQTGTWEESIRQANSIREKLTNNGVDENHVKKIVGYGNRHPLPPNDGAAEDINQRVSIIIRNKN